MTIQNSQNAGAIVGYQPRQDVAMEGAPGSSRLIVARPMVNPLLPQIGTLTVGGTADDGDYVATFTDLQTGEAVAVTVTRSTTPATNNDLAAALAAAINSAPRLLNLVRATVASAVVTVTGLHTNKEFAVATSAPGTGTLVYATTQAAGGTDIAVGRFVIASGIFGGQPGLAAPGNSAAAADLVGVTMRPLGALVNAGSPLASAVDVAPPGSVVGVGVDGEVWMRNNGSVAAAYRGAVFVVRNTAGGQQRGQARANADSTNTVELALTSAYWADPTPAGALGRVMIRL